MGQSAPLRDLAEEISRVAASDAKVLITGESGTGKELVARDVHVQSPRARRAFIPVNCAGLPETLLESELFGYVKGSFTGAHRDRPGKLEAADQGTIFLDEIGEMTPRMQGMLLRFLETGEVQKVGSDRIDRRLNVLMIAATNRNLMEMVRQGQFREDLFYRINVIHLQVPPLRERADDIPLLVDYFLARFTQAGNPNVQDGRRDDIQPSQITVPPEVLAALCRYPWPGNVRELENAIERMVVTARTHTLSLADLPREIVSQTSAPAPVFRERRKTIADELYSRVVNDGESFWTAVYPLYMQREITKSNVREVVRRGLKDSRGSYKIVAQMFNLGAGDYKRFLNFLRKHHCQLPFQEFRDCTAPSTGYGHLRSQTASSLSTPA